MSKISEIELFNLLKKEITNRFFESNSASSKDISDWKGQDIVTFQEDVFSKTKSTVSEKWFYTYFKSDFKKLPRIDMLNLLTQYIGYSGWAHFVQEAEKELEVQYERDELIDSLTSELANEVEMPELPPVEGVQEVEIQKETVEIQNEDPIVPPTKPEKKTKRSIMPLVLFTLLGLVIGGTSIYFAFLYQKTYEFCFMDADRNTAITEPIEITIQRKGFNPLELLTQNGCVEFASKEDTLLMFIKSTYYKQDTFKINLHSYQGRETIRLQPDDYKVMLRHYSKSSQSVKERIKMLDQMIADDALIYQVYDNEFFGVEVLSKKQYINLVSLPTTSLKNYTLIEAERKGGKIVKIKFKIQSDES